ncbi:MAG: SLC13 family permease [Bryobacteraceae bacterium]|nr:SLC13 family permease [Bryobacteraceae bacterium]
MGIEAIIVLCVTALILGLLAFTRIPPDAILIGGLVLLMIVPVPGQHGVRLGVISPDRAFGGFNNSGLLTVGVLFIVVRGLRETGAIDWIAQRVLGRPASLRGALTRLLLPVVGLSAFLNNTPLVAMMIPAAAEWARRLRLPPSKLMLPLSYAAILGGTCSLIGTSTNLVVSGLAAAHAGVPPIRMFDVAWIGLPCAAAGLLFILLLSPKLLPARGSAVSQLQDPREYLAEMIVPENSPLIGRSIEAAGLRHLPGAYVAGVERNGESIPAVSPEHVLRADDRLLFAGVVDSIKDLQNLRGLIPATDQLFKLDAPRYRRQLFEAVVSNTCPLVGKTIREGRFRRRYDAVVLAVSRRGERIQKKIGDIALLPGDTLLIESSRLFAARYKDSRDFFLVGSIDDSAPRRYDRSLVAVSILTGMVVVAALGWMPMLLAATIAASLMVLTRCCSVEDARASVDWSVLIVIGAALGIGNALEGSGGAGMIANAALAAVGERPWVALAVVYLVTSLMTEILTNNAAVALVFPIALATVERLDVNALPFVIAIMMAGSASFATPIGYQTNLMVYGPGGYRFSDYLRIGLPMNALVAITAIGLIPVIWPFR